MSRFRRRIIQQLALLLVSGGGCLALRAFFGSGDARFRWSISTGYVAVVLLVLTLVIGPLQTLLGRRTPVSSDLRRDVGIWACLYSVAHTIAGLQVHMRGKMWKYFVYEGAGSLFSRLRGDLFGLANDTGFVSVVLAVLLCVLSNDASLRRLGAPRWKRIQQANYLCFVLAIVHALLYQLVEKRTPPYAFVLGFLAAIAVTLQCARLLAKSG